MLESPRAWIVGHRGAAAEAVENTLASFRLAVEQGADMIELDVQLTADERLVAFHDWDLERSCGRPEVVEESAAERLAELVPDLARLEEVLAAVAARLPLNVELKRRRAEIPAYLEALDVALAERPRILLSSFDWELLRAARRRLPDRALAPLGDEKTAVDELLEIADELDAWSVHCHRHLASAELIERSDRPVLVYTVNDPAEARELFARGVAGVFTDAPGKLRTALGGHDT